MHEKPATPKVEAPHVIGVLAEYGGPDELIAAAEKVRNAGIRRWDCYSPFPVHGIDDAMGLKPTVLPWIVLCAGITGATTALALQSWTNGIDYPFMISGKPFFSWPAFIPVTFELTVLFSAFTAFFGMLLLNKLPRLSNPLLRVARFRRVTNDRFFIVIDSRDPKFNQDKMTKLLESTSPMAHELVWNDPTPANIPTWIKITLFCVALLMLAPPILVARKRSTTTDLPRIHIVPDMDFQPKFKPQSVAPKWIFADGRAMRMPVPGTIARGDLQADSAFYRGIQNEDSAPAAQPPAGEGAPPEPAAPATEGAPSTEGAPQSKFTPPSTDADFARLTAALLAKNTSLVVLQDEPEVPKPDAPAGETPATEVPGNTLPETPTPENTNPETPAVPGTEAAPESPSTATPAAPETPEAPSTETPKTETPATPADPATPAAPATPGKEPPAWPIPQQDPNAPPEPNWVTDFPLPVTSDLMKRGQRQYNIYCSVCHGLGGDGDGLVARRAAELQQGTWVQPTPMYQPIVVQQPIGRIYNTITHGIRKMPSYGEQIVPEDRWAIILYIRALQQSRDGTIKDVPAGELGELNRQ